MSWKGVEHVSLLTLEGRALMPIVLAPYQAARIDRRRDQADLVHRDGTFYLYVTVAVPEPPVRDVPDYLGVDLGIVNLAVDSDGTTYSGEAVEQQRRTYAPPAPQAPAQADQGCQAEAEGAAPKAG